MTTAHRPHRMFTGKPLAACLLALLSMHVGAAHAMSPPPPRDCSFFDASFRAFDATGATGPALRSLLAQAQSDDECIGQRLDAAVPGANVPALISLMRNDKEALVRRNAAAALGESSHRLFDVFQALSAKLQDEEDPTVAGARIVSLGRLMKHADNTSWNDQLSILMVIEAISAYWRPESPDYNAEMDRLNPQRIEAFSDIAGGLALHLNDRFYEASQQPGTPAVRAARKSPEVNAALIDGILRSFARPGDPARLEALRLLISLAKNGRLVGIRSETAGKYMRTLLPLLSDPDSIVRACATSAVSAALLAQAPHVDHAWQDFSPVLGSALVDELIAALGAGLKDDTSPVRSEAADGLGAFMRFRPSHVDTLVTLLSDPSGAVRTSAARALAQLAVLPAKALIPLQASAGRDDDEAEAAVIALSNHHSPAVVATLIAVLKRKPKEHDNAARYDMNMRLPYPHDLKGAAHRALRKLGGAAVLPLLAHVAATATTEERNSLFATLEELGWTRTVTNTTELVAALAPALSAADPETRVMALALLAKWRPYAAQPYPDAIADLATREYLSIPAHEAPLQPVSSNSMMLVAGDSNTATSNHSWAKDPQVSAAIVAGNSRWALAAQRQIAWMCSGRRLETGNVRTISLGGPPARDGQLHTIEHALGTMGTAALVPVLDALAKGASEHCVETLFRAFAAMDVDGGDTQAVARMLGALDSGAPGLRMALLHQLARTPDLPDAAGKPLLALANGTERQEAILALRALTRLARPIDVSGHALYAQAMAMPPSLMLFEKPLVPTLFLVSDNDLQDWKESLDKRAASWGRFGQNTDLDSRINEVQSTGTLGKEAHAHVPVLIKIMQAAPAQVREVAATSLGLIGAPGALPALLAAAKANPGTTLAQRAQLAAKRIRLAVARTPRAIATP